MVHAIWVTDTNDAETAPSETCYIDNHRSKACTLAALGAPLIITAAALNGDQTSQARIFLAIFGFFLTFAAIFVGFSRLCCSSNVL